MTESGQLSVSKPPDPPRRLQNCRICAFVTVAIFLLLAIIILILAFAIFKPKNPRTTLVSATVDGVAPRLSFPAVRIDFNVTLDLTILVQNPNHASFKHGQGKSLVLYRGVQVGDVEVAPGRIPSSGSENVTCRLTVDADNFMPVVGELIGDLTAGEVRFNTRTRIPGRVTFLRIFRKHAVATSDCHVAIAIPSLRIQRQECKQHTKI